MKIALIGPEIEENLSLRYLFSSVAASGHEARLFDFHSAEQLPELIGHIVDWAPDLAGLSMIFTARSREFMELARGLRDAGFAGHLTAGGHFAAFNALDVLRDVPALDSIVFGEGEEALVELADGKDWATIRGLLWRGPNGEVVDNGPRPNVPDLDQRRWPKRPSRFPEYFGFPIANLLSGRGCYANCHFCSINVWHRMSGGKRFRQRSVTNVADEMADLYHQHSVRIFNFQDDNFFLPTAAANLERFDALRAALEERGVRSIGIQAKARPDSIDEEVIESLEKLGLFRLFLGVETDAVVGLKTLGRGIEREQNHTALELLGRRGIHTAFNLLMFDPESTLETIRQNVEFMRRQHLFPLNFCRTEVYSGTALETRLRQEGRLKGDYLGYWYAIADPQAEAAYQMFRAVFTPRNFDAGGLHNESMKLDFYFHLLKHFYPQRVSSELQRRVKSEVAALNRNSAELMTQICDLAEQVGTTERGRLRALSAPLSTQRDRYDRFARDAFDRLSSELKTLACMRQPSRLRGAWKSAAVVGAATAVLLSTGCGSPQTPRAEAAPPQNEPAEQKRELNSENSRELGMQVYDMQLEHLAPILEQHGVRQGVLRFRIELDDAGRVLHAETTEATLEPLLEEAVLAEVETWTFANITQGGVIEASVVLGRPRPVNETHMWEMAPPPNDPIDPVELVEPTGPVIGTITVATEGKAGQFKVTIRGIGSEYGVSKDMTGKLKKSGKIVTLTSCESRTCQGVVEASADELKEDNKVEFLFPAE